MIIKALEKLTTLDYPGKVACTIFLFGCNFRCGFCHNPELVFKSERETISQEKVLAFLETRKGLLDGVCFTGGESMVGLDMDFVKKVKALGFSVKIDTNGSYPERLQPFIDEGLVDYVAMDIKAAPEHYEKMVGKGFSREHIEKSIKQISALPHYEFRTTIIPGYHDEGELKKMKEWVQQAAGKKVLHAYYLQGFVPQKGRMIDASFDTVATAKETWLHQLKHVVEDAFETCEVRI